MEKIKEWNKENKREVEATKIFMVGVQSATTNIIEEIDPKPVTVSFQGGEDDMTACILTNMNAYDTITSTPSTEYTTDVFQDGDILMKMGIVRPKEYYGKKYKSGLVKGKQARLEPAHACDCFGNHDGLATWDSKFYGVVGVLGMGVPRLACLRPTAWLS